jgi:hypothetical protein
MPHLPLIMGADRLHDKINEREPVEPLKMLRDDDSVIACAVFGHEHADRVTPMLNCSHHIESQSK